MNTDPDAWRRLPADMAMIDDRLRACGHTDPRSCDLSCRVLAIEAAQSGSVGWWRVMIDAKVRDRTRLLDQEILRLRHAIEDFILWWDMPPFVLDDDERLRAEVDALREAIK